MDILNKYLEEISQKKFLSPSTLSFYTKDIENYINYMVEKNIDIFKVSEEDFVSYFEELKKEFILSSLKRKYSTIKNFYKYLWKKRYVENIYEFNLDKKENKKTNYSYDKNKYLAVLNNLSENSNDMKFKIITLLIAKLDLSLSSVFDIQIKDLLKYEFKKIIIVKMNKIQTYDTDEDLENELKNFYHDYASEKRFLFSGYSRSHFYNDMKRFNLKICDLKNTFKKDEDEIISSTKEIYNKINLGDL